MRPEPSRTSQNKLVDSIRRNITLVEGEMACGDWAEAARCHRALGKDIIELTQMIEDGYAATCNTPAP
jgi:hypothetical protein